MAAGSMRRGAPRSLRARLALLTLTGTLVPIAILGWLSLSSVDTLRERVLAERQLLAESVAAQVDSALNAQFEQLEPVTPQPATGARGKFTIPSSILREDYVRSRLFSSVFVLDGESRVVQSEPGGVVPAVGSILQTPAATATFVTGTPQISALWSAPDGTRRLFLFVPLRSVQGAVVGALGGAIDPSRNRLRRLLHLAPLDSDETVDIVDQHGVVIATTAPERLYSQADHRSGAPAARAEEVIAFAPLPSRPSWGLYIRQPEDEAFGPAQALRWKILGWAAGLTLLALAFAFGVATSLTAPISLLEKTAGQIAAGQLEQPIPPLGDDEVGRLGTALERMRAALQRSLEDIARGRDMLEARVRERTAEIQQLYQKLQQRDQLRARLLEKVIGAQEEERRRIARELHDETSQELGALILALDAVLAKLPEGTPGAHLREAKSLALRALDGLHQLSFDLRPSVLDDLGLFRAIAWYAERDLKRRGIAVRCEFEGEDVRLPAGVETALFRTVQEAISNIVKHARAESVLIQAAANSGGVTIEIEDDGRGFDPASISTTAVNGRGLGLAGLRERVELLGGSATIESSPGHGTRVVLHVPQGGEHG